MKISRGAKYDGAKQRKAQLFNRILLDAKDEALSSLGENIKVSINSHLEDLFKIRKQEIPIRLADFSKALEQIYGLGARQLEIMFMKNLHAKINFTFKWPEDKWPLSKWILTEITFQEYVRLMRQKFEVANEAKIDRGFNE